MGRVQVQKRAQTDKPGTKSQSTVHPGPRGGPSTSPVLQGTLGGLGGFGGAPVSAGEASILNGDAACLAVRLAPFQFLFLPVQRMGCRADPGRRSVALVAYSSVS